MGASRLALLLLAAVATALILAACGSGAGSTSSAAPATGSTATTTQAPTATGKAHKASGESSSPPRSSAPAGPKPGASGGSIAKGGVAPFRTKGGDNSIQGFGGEAGSSELDQAAAALHAYLDARAAGEWQRACDEMASGVAKSLQQLATQGQGGKGKQLGCPQILAAMSAGMPDYIKRDTTQADVGALRVEGERAFLLYHGAHDTDYFMPMAKEGGEWKVAALAASALP